MTRQQTLYLLPLKARAQLAVSDRGLLTSTGSLGSPTHLRDDGTRDSLSEGGMTEAQEQDMSHHRPLGRL